MSKADIYFNLVDVSAKADTTAVTGDKQEFINLNDFKLEGLTAPKAATLETDYWKLDGTFDTFPDNPENVSWGLWSNSMSGANGGFTNPLVLTLTFQELHSVIGLSLEFNQYDNSYCDNMNAKFYCDTMLLADWSLQPDSWRFAYESTVEEFNKIVLTFYSMNKADRYLKLQSIVYGLIKKFDSNSVIIVNLLEEIDLSGNELSINTMDFTVHSEDDDFNIFNPTGIYNTLQRKQQISVIGNKNGFENNYGVFYLDTWKAAENKMIELSTVDAIGIMDGTYFYGGLYTNKLVSELVETIMTDAGFAYNLDSAFVSTTVSGWLPYCTHREALQQVAIAIGAYVDTSRGGTVSIKAQPSNNDAVFYLDKNKKHTGTKVNLKTYVTGVNVTEHNYVKSAGTVKLYEGTLEAGMREVIFDSPISATTISGATFFTRGANYCIVDVATTGTVVINGYKYSDNTKITKVSLPQISAGEKENILTLTDATLISGSNSKAVALRILYLCQKRIEQELTFTMDNEIVGGLASIEVMDGINRNGIITRLETDLANGFVTKAVVVGE